MVGIIADLHDHLLNFGEFTGQTARLNLTELWIAGDVGTPETVDLICQKFLQPIRLVAGNVETGHQIKQYQALTNHYPQLTWSVSEPLVWNLAERTIALFHFPRLAERYAKDHQPEVVISGHTHQPNLTKIGVSWHINPGTLAGIFTPATYVLADLDTMHFQLTRLYE